MAEKTTSCPEHDEPLLATRGHVRRDKAATIQYSIVHLGKVGRQDWQNAERRAIAF